LHCQDRKVAEGVRAGQGGKQGQQDARKSEGRRGWWRILGEAFVLIGVAGEALRGELRCDPRLQGVGERGMVWRGVYRRGLGTHAGERGLAWQ
jgi:hypothetical protein